MQLRGAGAGGWGLGLGLGGGWGLGLGGLGAGGWGLRTLADACGRLRTLGTHSASTPITPRLPTFKREPFCYAFGKKDDPIAFN